MGVLNVAGKLPEETHGMVTLAIGHSCLFKASVNSTWFTSYSRTIQYKCPRLLADFVPTSRQELQLTSAYRTVPWALCPAPVTRPLLLAFIPRCLPAAAAGATYLVDRAGRKKLLLISFAGMVGPVACLAASAKVGQKLFFGLTPMPCL